MKMRDYLMGQCSRRVSLLNNSYVMAHSFVEYRKPFLNDTALLLRHTVLYAYSMHVVQVTFLYILPALDFENYQTLIGPLPTSAMKSKGDRATVA